MVEIRKTSAGLPLTVHSPGGDKSYSKGVAGLENSNHTLGSKGVLFMSYLHNCCFGLFFKISGSIWFKILKSLHHNEVKA